MVYDPATNRDDQILARTYLIKIENYTEKEIIDNLYGQYAELIETAYRPAAKKTF